MRFRYRTGTAQSPIPSLGGSRQRHRPILTVRVTGPSDFVLRDGLLDSGADDTIFFEDVAATIGLDLSQAPHATLHLVGRGPVRCRYGQVLLRMTDYVETYEWPAVVGFVPFRLKYPLLGHAGFLQFLDSDLRGADREVDLTPNWAFPGQVF